MKDQEMTATPAAGAKDFVDLVDAYGQAMRERGEMKHADCVGHQQMVDQLAKCDYAREKLILAMRVPSPHSDALTPRDEFFKVILPGIMLRWGEKGYTDHSAIAEAWNLSDAAMKAREVKP